MSELKYLPINWVDGMKVTRRHFQETQDFFTYQLMNSNVLKLSGFNYGILPGELSLMMNVQCFDMQITVEITHCNAITQGGSPIVIQPENKLKTSINFKDIANTYSLSLSQQHSLCILISVNLFKHLPYGNPLPDENPPRNPYTIPELHLDILPANNINTKFLSHNLMVGRIRYNNGELFDEKEFIAPCTSTLSLPVLQKRFEDFRGQLELFENYCTKVIEKINLKGNKNDLLPRCIGKLAEMILLYIADNKVYYRLIIPHSPPIYMCEVLLRLLQHIQSTIQCFSSIEREEVINYFVNWCPNFVKGEIPGKVAHTLQIGYDQHNMAELLSEIARTYKMCIDILEVMTKLEYIGVPKPFTLKTDVLHDPEKTEKHEKPKQGGVYNPSATADPTRK